AVVEPFTELPGLGPEFFVAHRLVCGFEGVDVGDQPLQRPQTLAFTGSEYSIEKSHESSECNGAAPPAPRRAATVRGECACNLRTVLVRRGQIAWVAAAVGFSLLAACG